jgi:hypothetical protein
MDSEAATLLQEECSNPPCDNALRARTRIVGAAEEATFIYPPEVRHRPSGVTERFMCQKLRGLAPA